MGWQTLFNELSNVGCSNECDEVCQCMDRGSLLFNITSQVYKTEGDCSLSKICSHIMRDKHQARISTAAFIRHRKAEKSQPPRLLSLDDFLAGR